MLGTSRWCWLAIPSAEQVLSAIRAKVDHPSTVRELMQRLRLPREQRATLRRRLAALVESGALIKVRGNRYGVPERMRLVTGAVHVHPRGFGFVTPDQSLEGVEGDLFIAGANLNQAMHGDRVVARVEHRKDPGRSEGHIIRILERASDTLVGRFEIDESGLGYVVPFDRRMVMDVHVPRGETGGAEAREMVMVQITRWPSATRSPVGRVVEVLGDIESPGVDTQLIIRKYGIPDAHAPEVVLAAQTIGTTVTPRDLEGRQDFRAWPTVTIDGETARDFDDAITVERLPNGNVWLGVHIADVSHYVTEGGPLDTAALERGTSVYFADRAVHMFPEALATGLCSLNPHVDRLVQSCLMEIDHQGAVRRYELHDGVVHSDARLTYSEVNAILAPGTTPTVEDSDPTEVPARNRHAELVPMLELMAELFQALNGRRRRRGSIDFDLPAAEFLLDDAGRVEAIVAAERNVAHRLIEEFMLVANETVATHLEERGVSTLFRVHESPDPKKVAEFEDFVTSLGYSLGRVADVTPALFQKLLHRLRDRTEARAVAFLMLRTMQQARYDPSNLGHFGLATPSYAHFTSPIRRYPDLVVHRAVRRTRQTGSLAGKDLPTTEQVAAVDKMAHHTSQMERRAEAAERESVQWKKVRFMADKAGDEFTGWVTGVTAFGLFVELVEQFVEGLVHISSMADDYYRFVERQHELRGENLGTVYKLGDRVRVQLVRVDREHRQLELALTEVLERVRESTPRRGISSRGRPKGRPRSTKGPSIR